MDRLHSDPWFLACPDFMIDWYQISCTSMVTANVTEAQAAKTLCNIWVVTNEALCLQWQEQVVEDDHLRAETQCLANEEQEHQQITLWVEDAATKADEQKKNHFKHLAIPMHPCPLANEEDVLVSDFALHKLDKGQYVELYYWTNLGLHDALTNYSGSKNCPHIFAFFTIYNIM
ncbi:uncharacterized protein BJ212DRAFT_1257574 [Suillus subaureus]|uniref:Uncharacterized protein n=1 Tax=Suillus subaureus TaxID=48587 RepID=A0A9P7EPL8_9AGAM|nr:uncharacterized protein BJ212DRAFT_1257574 [Suillus subaureus]KAG1826975.1 hypothetical protein BJ212DRAFT_1257574 [Suillus subaureus]